MSTHNICFYGELTKIIFQLSSNTLLLCSTDFLLAIRVFSCFFFTVPDYHTMVKTVYCGTVYPAVNSRLRLSVYQVPA